MRRLAGWRARALTLALVLGSSWGVFVLLDFDPEPVRLLLVMTLLLVTLWTVLDGLVAPAAIWRDGGVASPASPASLREDPRLVALDRMVQSHLTAREPSPALAETLVRLARLRDPDLERPGPAAVVAELTDPDRRPARLTPADVDRLLTRIEEA